MSKFCINDDEFELTRSARIGFLSFGTASKGLPTIKYCNNYSFGLRQKHLEICADIRKLDLPAVRNRISGDYISVNFYYRYHTPRKF